MLEIIIQFSSLSQQSRKGVGCKGTKPFCISSRMRIDNMYNACYSELWGDLAKQILRERVSTLCRLALGSEASGKKLSLCIISLPYYLIYYYE